MWLNKIGELLYDSIFSGSIFSQALGYMVSPNLFNIQVQ